MGQILKDIYSDILIASLLGFKGGTAAYFFYGLARFSVDLDFDLLSADAKSQEIVFARLVAILGKYGALKDQRIKRNTIFALLSYGDTDHNIKVEISIRGQGEDIRDYFEIKEYLGISMLVAKKEYLFASKLVALTSRNKIAMRDVYDIYFFAKNNWDINVEVVQNKTGKEIKKYLLECVRFIEEIKNNQILQGLGELLPEKEKQWIKNHLKSETIFMLKNYISVYGGN